MGPKEWENAWEPWNFKLLAHWHTLVLGAGLGIPSEPRSSKVRLIVLLSNRMTSGIHALGSKILIMFINLVNRGPNCPL